MSQFSEYEDTEAFAKIQGPQLMKFIKKESVVLGREVSLIEQNPNEDIIFIGDSPKISRKHLSIFWNAEKGRWCAENLSKNYVFINKKMLKQGDIPLVLDYVSSIRIDSLNFYFFQSREEEPNSIPILNN